MKALILTVFFSLSAGATVLPDEVADFGPLPKNFMNNELNLPLSTRIEMDLRNIIEYKYQRTEILEARIQLFVQKIDEVKKVAKGLQGGSLSRKFYDQMIERIEKKHFPEHTIHEELAEISNVNSRHEVMLKKLLGQARYYEAHPDGDMVFVDHEKLKNDLMSSFFRFFEVGGRIAAKDPYWVLRGQRFNEMEFYLQDVLPESTKSAYDKCDFRPMARIAQDPKEEINGVVHLNSDSAVISKILDGGLKVVCGKKSLKKDFHYDPETNTLYNYRYFNFNNGRFEDSSISPTLDGIKAIRGGLNRR